MREGKGRGGWERGEEGETGGGREKEGKGGEEPVESVNFFTYNLLYATFQFS